MTAHTSPDAPATPTTLGERLRQQILTAPASRRAFLRQASFATVAAGAAGALAACTEGGAAQQQGNAAPAGGGDHSGGSLAAHPAPAAAIPNPMAAGAYGGLTLAQARARADQMDAMHEKGVKAFPAPTKGKGNQPLDPRVENGVEIFELTARPVEWETEPGKTVLAWAYNDQAPGPQIRVIEGDRVRLVV